MQCSHLGVPGNSEKRIQWGKLLFNTSKLNVILGCREVHITATTISYLFLILIQLDYTNFDTQNVHTETKIIMN